MPASSTKLADPGHSLSAHLQRLHKWPELPLLATLFAVSSLTWGFCRLAGEVRDGATQGFDYRVVAALRDPANPRLPIGPAWLIEAGRDITSFGSVTGLTLMTVLASIYLALDRKWRSLGLMLTAVGGGLLISGLLKQHFERPRPPFGSDLSQVFTSSFPSGHSLLSATVYLALGMMLARSERRYPIKVFFIVAAVLISGLVGVSRVYLGVHYPTDVLAGWTVGLAWAIGWWFVARWFELGAARRPSDTIEPPTASA